MTDSNPHPDSDDESTPDTEADSASGTPRWVYVFGVTLAVLALAFVALHLASGGFRGHAP